MLAGDLQETAVFLVAENDENMHVLVHK